MLLALGRPMSREKAKCEAEQKKNAKKTTKDTKNDQEIQNLRASDEQESARPSGTAYPPNAAMAGLRNSILKHP